MGADTVFYGLVISATVIVVWAFSRRRRDGECAEIAESVEGAAGFGVKLVAACLLVMLAAWWFARYLPREAF